MLGEGLEPNSPTRHQTKTDLEVAVHVWVIVIGVRADNVELFQHQLPEVDWLWRREAADDHDCAPLARDVHGELWCWGVSTDGFDHTIDTLAIGEARHFGDHIGVGCNNAG